ncbi:carbon storage regulator [Tepidibacter hydrothermalis]|uniref:Carbon storage regulator n=1 Tax=Tepidibacter hydrothermalis TaxID=3036126 RepID=A0ABY8E6W8_9FIRM|nr:carbon storage regulator [Tepidibacter hydrothermalis]WFD08647.1 carbon storage regulator [Tepidibacter hydrothermalis]
MLVLGIKPGEFISINENVKINFVKVKENTIRVAIDAPKEVTILREGVQDKNILTNI